MTPSLIIAAWQAVLKPCMAVAEAADCQSLITVSAEHHAKWHTALPGSDRCWSLYSKIILWWRI